MFDIPQTRSIGAICIGRRKINLSTVFAGQSLGISEVDHHIWLEPISKIGIPKLLMQDHFFEGIDTDRKM